MKQMKASWARVVAAGVLAGFGLSAQAALVNAGNGLINDTDRNIAWTQDANLFKTMAAENSNLVNEIIAVTPAYVDQFGVSHTISADFAGNLLQFGNMQGHELAPSTGQMSWYGAQAWVNYLNATNYKGYSNWRLPEYKDTGAPGCDNGYSGTDCGYNVDPDSSEFAHLYYEELGNQSRYTISGQARPGTAGVDWGLTNTGPFTNLQKSSYWLGDYQPCQSCGWVFSSYDGMQGNTGAFFPIYTLVVTDVAIVPVPATVWLMGSGLVGLLGWGRRKAGRLVLG